MKAVDMGAERDETDCFSADQGKSTLRKLDYSQEKLTMHHPTLDSLLLTEEELAIARDQVQTMAYLKWLDAGQPDDDSSLAYWTEAELEWIEYRYVPHREAMACRE